MIGWREYVALPDLGVERIKAKVDTGARSSAIHAFNVERFDLEGVPHVRFEVHPEQRRRIPTVQCAAPLADERWVRNSTGQRTFRPVIHTALALMDRRIEIELTLVNRDPMGFRMLLGREALRGRFLIDPGRSFRNGRPRKPSPPRRRAAGRPRPAKPNRPNRPDQPDPRNPAQDPGPQDASA